MAKPSQLSIEPALAADIPCISQLLAESLFDDPLQCWLFPDESKRLATSKRMFRRLLKAKVKQGLVRVIRDKDGKVASVAVWTPPHPPAPTRWEHYAESLFMRLTYGKRIHEIRRGFTALADRHPKEPYWYLQALATDPKCRGVGHGSALVNEQLCICNTTDELVALETSSPTNLSYYQKLGFDIADELHLTDALPVWLLCRSAGTSAICGH